MRKNWFLEVGTLLVAILFIGAMILVPRVKAADDDDIERDADWLTYPYTGLYGGGYYGSNIYGGGASYGGGYYGGSLYGGGYYGSSLYGGSLYGGGYYGGSLYGGGLYGSSLYGGGWGGLSSWSSPFGMQNLYYPIETGTGLNFQIPFVQIAPYLGMASFYNQIFPNLFDYSSTFSVLPDSLS